ncbi:hypothetical protein [Gulosibacter faecalis]|uniref:Scaffolding protein n=1 Tax=Gulosibacter faecalis TaxID=272240 RepID=A0ABW5UUG1_9MICO|nr:hypothetical protein [Gulosibacter faecalis]
MADIATDQIEDGQEPELEQDEHDEQDDGQEPDDPQESTDEGFEGDFDPKRARRTIDRLRQENKQLKAKPKDADVQRENLQLRAALKLGVPESFASRLRGETVEEMIEDAGELLDALGVKGGEKDDTALRAPRREPRRRLSGGSQPAKEPEMSADDIVNAAIGN